MNYSQLSQEERYHMKALLKTGLSQAAAARKMGKNKSTISRELSRNLRSTGDYTPSVIHSYATARRKKTGGGSQFTKQDWQLVIHFLKMKYSPEHMSNHLTRFALLSMSHETIYHYSLWQKKRRKRYNSRDSRGRLAGKRMIGERP